MKIFPLIFCALLYSCSAKEISYNYPDNPDYARKSRAGAAFSKRDLVVYDGKKNVGGASSDLTKSTIEKSELWKSCVEIIGALLPISILNSDAGIITTEWYQNSPNSRERIKINALVRGSEMKKENLQITIFKQKKSAKKNSSEIWEDFSRENSDSDGVSAKILRDKILGSDHL